jgi:hypothetical protein
MRRRSGAPGRRTHNATCRGRSNNDVIPPVWRQEGEPQANPPTNAAPRRTTYGSVQDSGSGWRRGASPGHDPLLGRRSVFGGSRSQWPATLHSDRRHAHPWGHSLCAPQCCRMSRRRHGLPSSRDQVWRCLHLDTRRREETEGGYQFDRSPRRPWNEIRPPPRSVDGPCDLTSQFTFWRPGNT